MTKNTDQFDNISFIQYLNRRVLEEAEEAMILPLPGDDLPPVIVKSDGTANDHTDAEKETAKKRRSIRHRWNRIWGKSAVMDVLDQMTDIELKIYKERPAPSSKQAELTEREMELLREFMRKE